jgi:hypothetical protein
MLLKGDAADPLGGKSDCEEARYASRESQTPGEKWVCGCIDPWKP